MQKIILDIIIINSAITDIKNKKTYIEEYPKEIQKLIKIFLKNEELKK